MMSYNKQELIETLKQEAGQNGNILTTDKLSYDEFAFTFMTPSDICIRYFKGGDEKTLSSMYFAFNPKGKCDFLYDVVPPPVIQQAYKDAFINGEFIALTQVRPISET